MFYEWVSHGAEIGLTTFFALMVFGVCIMAVLGLFALIGEIFKGDNNR